MNIYRLSLADGFADPRWVAIAQRGRVPVVGNVLTFHGKRLLSAEALPEGALMEVWCNSSGFFVCALASEYDQAEADKKVLAEQARQAEHQKTQARKTNAIAFNASLNIPVKWTPGHKDVLSGLADGSSGTGLNVRSVTHVLLQEALQFGRVSRQPGDFLCTSAAGTNGKRWSSQTAAAEHVQVTCKACLKLAQRWSNAD